jgi:glycine cleavage system aminomethyltransferase T
MSGSVYLAIKEAGEEFGIADFGMRALLSMRLEKNFPTWGHELRPIYGPFEGAMDRFVKLDKNDFIGREQAAKEKADGPKLRRVSLAVDALDADVMRRADLGEGRRHGLRHGRKAAWPRAETHRRRTGKKRDRRHSARRRYAASATATGGWSAG